MNLRILRIPHVRPSSYPRLALIAGALWGAVLAAAFLGGFFLAGSISYLHP